MYLLDKNKKSTKTNVVRVSNKVVQSVSNYLRYFTKINYINSKSEQLDLHISLNFYCNLLSIKN